MMVLDEWHDHNHSLLGIILTPWCLSDTLTRGWCLLQCKPFSCVILCRYLNSYLCLCFCKCKRMSEVGKFEGFFWIILTSVSARGIWFLHFLCSMHSSTSGGWGRWVKCATCSGWLASAKSWFSQIGQMIKDYTGKCTLSKRCSAATQFRTDREDLLKIFATVKKEMHIPIGRCAKLVFCQITSLQYPICLTILSQLLSKNKFSRIVRKSLQFQNPYPSSEADTNRHLVACFVIRVSFLDELLKGSEWILPKKMRFWSLFDFFVLVDMETSRHRRENGQEGV